MLRTRKASFAALVALIALALVAGPVEVAGEEHEQVENPGFLAAKGRITYGRYCANCHGADAKGNGSIAKFLKIPPTDLTMIEREEDGGFPYDRLSKVIAGAKEVRGHGSREMPIWGDVFKDPMSESYANVEETGKDRAERMIRELIFYIETLQEAQPEEPAAGG